MALGIKESGISLIEVLVVMAMMGLLVYLSSPNKWIHFFYQSFQRAQVDQASRDAFHVIRTLFESDLAIVSMEANSMTLKNENGVHRFYTEKNASLTPPTYRLLLRTNNLAPVLIANHLSDQNDGANPGIHLAFKTPDGVPTATTRNVSLVGVKMWFEGENAPVLVESQFRLEPTRVLYQSR